MRFVEGILEVMRSLVFVKHVVLEHVLVQKVNVDGIVCAVGFHFFDKDRLRWIFRVELEDEGGNLAAEDTLVHVPDFFVATSCTPCAKRYEKSMSHVLDIFIRLRDTVFAWHQVF